MDKTVARINAKVVLKSVEINFSNVYSPFSQVNVLAEIHPFCSASPTPAKMSIALPLAKELDDVIMRILGEACIEVLEREGETGDAE